MQDVQRVRFAQRFDGLDPSAGHLADGNETAIDRLSVDQHRAGSALPLAATFFRSGKVEILTQNVDQSLEGLTLVEPRLAVNAQSDHAWLGRSVPEGGEARE